MKLNIFFALLSLFIFANYTPAACPVDKIQSGENCSAMTESGLNITPDKSNTQNKTLPDPNKDSFAPNMNIPSQVQDLGSVPAVKNNSSSGAYSSNCQFGVCPQKLNNREFKK